ncbi:MAG: T9SS type A sorting domain-containing protein, partial [Bacteroidota bacterium]
KKPIIFGKFANASSEESASCNWDNNTLYITSKNKVGAQYEIFDISGKLLKTGFIVSDQQLALDNAIKAMYIIKITSNNSTLTLKSINL